MKKKKHWWGWGIRTASAKQLSFYNTKPMCVCVESAGGAVPPSSVVGRLRLVEDQRRGN